MKSALGISANRVMPSRVAAIGSKRASVAVSKDFRPESEEKYSECAREVGRTPSPTSTGTASQLIAENSGPDLITTLAASTAKADNI
jgi:hypothetical protein